jgi:uncharacterized protein YndB with AHSA1/START domain
MKASSVTFERVYDAPASRVWTALTDRNEMEKWYFNIAEFKPIVGFEFTFEGGTETEKFVHLCKILEVIPERKLSYSWSYQGFPGYSVVTFELIAEGERTRLRLTHDGVETFLQDHPAFAKQNFSNGWDAILGKNLPEYLQHN